MKIVRDPARTEPCVLVLGMFDGVHRGHQALLMQGVERSRALGIPLNVCTFEPHPLAVLRPQAAPQRLTTQTERAQLMAGFGVDSLCVMTFTHALADQEPEAFMAEMTARFSPQVVVCGFNFTFGRRGRGNGDALRDYGAAHGFEVVIVPEVVLEGATVSSTRIRALLDAGSMPEAARLMGHAYTLTGRVRTSGSIVAGQSDMTVTRSKALPAPGLYACYLTVGGQNYPAMAELPADSRRVAVIPLDSLLMLHERRVRLTFMKQLRRAMSFGSSNDEQAQRRTDAAAARTFFFEME